MTVEVADGARETVTADHYVAALPVEQLRLLVTPEMRAAEPALARLDRLVTRWMNGIMFYLDTDVPIVNGHAIYIDSEWALTSISQQQFWRGIDLESYGDGRVEGILSVDVSEWDRPGRRTGKVASKCSADEIRAEVRGQLADHLNDGPAPVLSERNVVAWFLDPAIAFPNPSGANAEPLLINTAGSWEDRPEAVTRIANLTSPPTSCGPTPTSPPWRAPTRRPGAPSTRSSSAPARRRRAARSGGCGSPTCSRRPVPSTGCAGDYGGARRGRRCA